MNRKFSITLTFLSISAAILLAAVSPVSAANGTAPTAGCQPGAGNDLMGSWQLLSLEEYADLLNKEYNAPNYESALARATATYAFCDKNGDNYACVMTQNLPNDANGSDTWLLVEDNHFPFGSN